MANEAMPVGSTAREPKRVIGKSGKAPQGVEPDKSGTRARSIASKRKAPERGVSDLGVKREIRIMHGFKVPFPRLGDRRALLAPNVPEYLRKAKDPRAFRAFAVVEYAGNKCVRVHGATDDARQASAAALAVAARVHSFIQRGAVGVASRNGRTLGKELPPVAVYDMTGMGLAPKKRRNTSAPKQQKAEREFPVTRTFTSEGARIQWEHARDIKAHGACTACADGPNARVANARCGANAEVSEGLAEVREAISETAERPRNSGEISMTEALKAAFAPAPESHDVALAMWEDDGGQ